MRQKISFNRLSLVFLVAPLLVLFLFIPVDHEAIKEYFVVSVSNNFDGNKELFEKITKYLGVSVIILVVIGKILSITVFFLILSYLFLFELPEYKLAAIASILLLISVLSFYYTYWTLMDG